MLLGLPLLVKAASLTSVDPTQEDYYWDVVRVSPPPPPSSSAHGSRGSRGTLPPSLLYQAISTRQWTKALQILADDGDEAGVLVVVRRRNNSNGRNGRGSRGNIGGRGGGRGATAASEVGEERALPIHALFAVDLVHDVRRYDLPPTSPASSAETNSTAAMSPAQTDLVTQLLSHHPLGTRLLDHYGRLPLHLAAYSVVSPPREVVVALMRAYDAGEDYKDDDDSSGGKRRGDDERRTNGGGTNVCDANGLLPLHAACSAPISTFEVISTLVEANPTSVSTWSKAQNAALPIHYAAYGGSRHSSTEMVQIFQLLVEGYTESVWAKDGDGDTVLDIMVKYGRTDLQVFEYLVQRVVVVVQDAKFKLEGGIAALGDQDNTEDGDEGNNEDGSNSRHRGNTLLHNAVAMAPHHLTADMVRILLRTSPTLAQAINNDQQVPLHSALEHAGTTAEIIQILLEAHPDSIRVKDGLTGRLPLHMACAQGVADVDAIQLLVEAYPAAVLILDGDDGEDGRLPLHLALGAPQRGGGGTSRGGTKSNNDKVIQYLLSVGPSASATVDAMTGMYPLHVAIQRHKSPTVVKAILEAYPDAAVELVGAATDQTSALHLLASVQDQYTSEEAVEIARAILEVRSESVKIVKGSGRLPLHLASDTSDDRGSGKSKKQQKKKKTKNKKRDAIPEKNLVGTLLDADPDGARVKDADGNLPLHYAVASFDANTAMQLLEVYEDGAKDEEHPLLPIACGSLKTLYEPYRGEEDAVDRILKRLLDIYPDAAKSAGDDGKLPLSILLDRPNILEHVDPTTFKSLLDANIEVARHRVNDAGDYPLQKAISNMRNSKDPGRSLALVEMLMDAYPDVVREKNDRGVTLFQQVLTQAQGTVRQFDGSHALSKLARRLYELYPEAVSIVGPSEHYPLHSLARIMGQTAGSSNRVSTWAPLFRDVLDVDSTLADVPDNKGRPPLHIMCFHLGDAAYDNEDGGQYERSEDFDSAVRDLIAKSSNVLRFEDKDGQSPIDLLKRELKGRSSTKLSQTLQFVKEEIKEAKKRFPTRTTEDASDTTQDEL